MSTTDVAVQETALLQVDQLQQIVATAPEILSRNIESKNKAIEAGTKLIELAKTGMNEVYDAQLANFITKAKKTIELMNDRRKPFTQIVDSVKKQFTTLESELKPIIEESQTMRNAFATQIMVAKQEEERKAALVLEHDKELIEVRKTVEVLISGFFNSCIETTKSDIIAFFNNLTLETIETADKVFSTTSTQFDSRYNMPTEIKLGMNIRHSTDEEVNGIIGELLTADYSLKKREYSFEISGILKEYSDKLPSKRAELEEISKAGAEEKLRLEKLAEERKQAESKRMADEKIAREAKAQEEAAINASAATAGALVDASVTTSEAPNVKEAYQIIVKNNAGYLLLTQLWFEKEGKALTPEKLEKYTFDRVKRFCETFALKNEEFIQSPLISYQPVYKAK